MKRHIGRALGLFWGGLATLLIGFALFIQIGRQTLPSLSDWKDDIEFYFSNQLGLSVSFENIWGSWSGLSPEISIIDLTLIDSQGRQTLHVGRAVARLDLLQSLNHFTWYFEQVEVTGVAAILEQEESGRWGLAGALASQAEDRDMFHFDPLKVLLSLNYVHLSDIDFQFNFRSGRQHNLNLTSLVLGNDKDFHRLVASLDLPDNKQALRLVYEGVEETGGKKYSGKGYLELNDYPLKDSVAFASESVAEYVGIKDGYVSASLWFEHLADFSLKLKGSAQFERNVSAASIEGAVPEQIVSDITANWHPSQGWQLRLQQAQAFWPNRELEPLDLVVSGGFQMERFTFGLSELEVQPWVDFMRSLDLLPDVADRILGELNVAGKVSDFQLQIAKDRPSDFLLKANLQNISVNEWKGSPQIANLDGYIEASALSGFVQINSQKTFLMHYPDIFAQPFVFDTAQGEVGWRVEPENNQVLVNSGLLTMRGGLGVTNGYFYLDAPLERGSRLNELVLQIGLQGGKVSDHQRLIPFIVPDSIGRWIDDALVAGDISSGGFAMQGYFGRKQEGELSLPRSIQVALNVSDTEIDYDSRWPELKQLSGFVQLDIPAVDAWIDKGNILQANMSGGRIHIRDNPQGDGQLLKIKAALDGNASSGLRVFTDTPLKEVVGGAFDNWLLNGELKAGLELEIPLSAGEPGSFQQVVAELSDVELQLQDVNLTITDLDAQLNYETGKGITADNIVGLLWQEKLSASIASVGRQSEGDDQKTMLTFNSSLDFENLATWSGRAELMFVEGVVPIEGTIEIGADGLLLNSETQLQGAAINLPLPFGKKEAEKRLLTVSVPVDKSGYQLHFNYVDQIFGNFSFLKLMPVSGVVSLGQPLPDQQQGIWLKGVVDELNGRDWWPLVDRYQLFDQQLEKGKTHTSESPFNLELKIKLFNWDEWQLDDFTVSGSLRNGDWLLSLSDERVAGDLSFFSDGRPPEVDLEYIRWPQPAPIIEPQINYSALGAQPVDQVAEVKSDLLSDFDPSSLIAMKFNVDEFLFGAQDYGRWSFMLEPNEKGLLVRNIVGSIRHVDVTGPEGAELFWAKDEGLESTTFKGNLAGKNLADVTDAWGLPRLMESKSIALNASLGWQGSPAMIAVNELQGDLLLNIGNGRFYQSTGQASNALLRLVGLFNFDSWARRLKFDFTDVYKGGLPFEKINGAMTFERGIIYLHQPLTVENTSSSMKMGGKINLNDESLDASLVATLPVGGNATFFTALAAGLPAAAGVYIVSKVFKKQMEKVASVSYEMKGSWSDPEITFDKFFDNQAAKKAGEKSRQESEDHEYPNLPLDVQ